MAVKIALETTLFLFSFAILGMRAALAGGFAIPHQTARGVALSNALTAGVDDPSAVYYNPAALGQVEGNQLLLTGTYINVINSIENGGRNAVNKHNDNFLGSFFGNYHIPGTDFTLGLGAYTPFGLATSYGGGLTRFAARETQLKTLYLTPALSWHPSQLFSLGVGFSFVHSAALLSRSLCFDITPAGCVPTGGVLEGKAKLTDTANAFTYNIGTLIKPTDNLKIGFSYRAGADLRFDSADVKLSGAFAPANTRADVRPIPLPSVINVGLFWAISPSWGAEFVYEYTRWSEFKSLKATFSPTPVFLPFAAPVNGLTLPQDWKDTNTLRLGSFYRVNKNWELRAGIGVEESPIPNRTLNPAIPGADLLTLNAGIGYKWQNFSIDFGYQAVFYKARRVRNSELEGTPATGIPFLGAPGKDTYETFNNFVSLSLGYRF